MLPPFGMSAARTERLLNLLTLLLNSRRPIALREIRELDEFGAYRTDDPKSGERAFERDKAALLDLGVPLRWVAPEHEDDEEGQGGYVVDRSRYFLPELHLSPSEMALLSIAGAAAAALTGFSGKAALVRALAKLGFDAVETAGLPALAHAPLLQGTDAQRVGSHLAVLHDAIAHRRLVTLHYVADGLSRSSCASVVTARSVRSYGLYYRQGSWYLVGFCQLRRATRTFNLSRVQKVWAQGPAAAFEVPEHFDLADHMQRRPWEFAGGPPVCVTIRLAARLRSAIGEIFGPRAEVEPGPPCATHITVRLQVTSPEALVRAVLPYGAAAEVVAPAHVRRQLALQYKQLAAKYSAADSAADTGSNSARSQLPQPAAAP
jgi:predicted DNA-binding transcriptional regulator YafY